MILLRKYNFELYMTATELTESTERGVWGGKSISVLSVAESYKKQIQFSRNRKLEVRFKQECNIN